MSIKLIYLKKILNTINIEQISIIFCSKLVSSFFALVSFKSTITIPTLDFNRGK